MKPYDILTLVADTIMNSVESRKVNKIAAVDTLVNTNDLTAYNLIVMEDGTEFEMIIKKPLKKKYS
jgi:hypothetical protein